MSTPFRVEKRDQLPDGDLPPWTHQRLVVLVRLGLPSQDERINELIRRRSARVGVSPKVGRLGPETVFGQHTSLVALH